MAAAVSSPSIGRRSRQTVEEELWLLRSSKKNFVKSESLRLNSLSPRSSHNCSDDNNNRTTRRWRRRRGVGHNNHNFIIEGMRDAARKARVFQLRISGRRSWWPTIHTARIDAGTCISQQRQRDGSTELNLISNTDQFDKRRKNFEGRNKENESIPKKKFEWNNIWKRKNRSNNESDGEVGASTSIDESTDVNTSMNTTMDDEVVDEGTKIEEHAEDTVEKDGEDKKKKKNRQNVVVAAVATTSVSSLGVALAILLL